MNTNVRTVSEIDRSVLRGRRKNAEFDKTRINNAIVIRINHILIPFVLRITQLHLNVADHCSVLPNLLLRVLKFITYIDGS